MINKVDLHTSSVQEHKEACIEHVKNELLLYPELMDSFLEYLYDKAYIKAEVETDKRHRENWKKEYSYLYDDQSPPSDQ
jgi:hypothetical protein